MPSVKHCENTEILNYQGQKFAREAILIRYPFSGKGYRLDMRGENSVLKKFHQPGSPNPIEEVFNPTEVVNLLTEFRLGPC